MLHSPPVSSSPSPAIATSPRTNVVNLTASINGSPTISTLSYPLSASKPLLNQYNENKILVSRCISTKLLLDIESVVPVEPFKLRIQFGSGECKVVVIHTIRGTNPMLP